MNTKSLARSLAEEMLVYLRDAHRPRSELHEQEADKRMCMESKNT